MSIVDWLLVAWFGLIIMANVALIGEERKPITPGSALITLLICTCWIVALILSRAA